MINSVIHHLGIGLRDPQAGERFFDSLFIEFLAAAQQTYTAGSPPAGHQ